MRFGLILRGFALLCNYPFASEKVEEANFSIDSCFCRSSKSPF